MCGNCVKNTTEKAEISLTYYYQIATDLQDVNHLSMQRELSFILKTLFL